VRTCAGETSIRNVGLMMEGEAACPASATATAAPRISTVKTHSRPDWERKNLLEFMAPHPYQNFRAGGQLQPTLLDMDVTFYVKQSKTVFVFGFSFLVNKRGFCKNLPDVILRERSDRRI
jgi:hypothetical protein